MNGVRLSCRNEVGQTKVVESGVSIDSLHGHVSAAVKNANTMQIAKICRTSPWNLSVSGAPLSL